MISLLLICANCTAQAPLLCRAYNEEAAYTYEVDMPPKPGLYFASFQPEARFNLDLNSTAPVVPEELPFPALELGPVIGKGSFGYVCKGLLGHVIVAVKVSDNTHLRCCCMGDLPKPSAMFEGASHLWHKHMTQHEYACGSALPWLCYLKGLGIQDHGLPQPLED